MSVRILVTESILCFCCWLIRFMLVKMLLWEQNMKETIHTKEKPLFFLFCLYLLFVVRLSYGSNCVSTGSQFFLCKEKVHKSALKVKKEKRSPTVWYSQYGRQSSLGGPIASTISSYRRSPRRYDDGRTIPLYE